MNSIKMPFWGKAVPATAALWLLINLTGCKVSDNQSEGDLRWTENVAIPDGRIIKLTRHQEFKGPHELGQPPSASNYWIEFENPDTGEKVKWQQSHAGEYLNGVALFIHQGAPYLLTMPAMGRSWERYKCPNPAYILFKKPTKSDWVKVPLEDIPIKQIRANMTFDVQEKASAIRKSNHVLGAQETSKSYVGANQKFLIDLSSIETHKFDWPNCKEFNLSLIKQTGD